MALRKERHHIAEMAKGSLTDTPGNKGGKKGGFGVVPPFLPSWVSAPFPELPRALCWDRASGGSQPLWSVGDSVRRARGRICHFQWKTEWWLLIMVTLYFGSEFAAPFFYSKIPTG